MRTQPQAFIYSIRVRGMIPEAWKEAFADLAMDIGQDDCGTFTQLQGQFADLAALQGVLNNVYNLGLILISIKRMDECRPCAGKQDGCGVC
jgi:hypothetical protein